MDIIKLTSKMLSSNCYILINNNKAIVIDPAVKADKIVSEVERNNAIITKIIYTHAHADHIIFGDKLKKLTNAPTYGHANDRAMYGDNMKNGAILFGLRNKFDVYDNELVDGSVLDFEGISINIIHTPGHTMGSICIYVQGNLFTGDTLFYESVGRTDLGNGDWNTLKDSITNKLYTLPEDTIVLPGHGISSTIKHEKENNPYV